MAVYDAKYDAHEVINVASFPNVSYITTGLHMWLQQAKSSGFLRMTELAPSSSLPDSPAFNDIVYIRDSGIERQAAPTGDASLRRWDGTTWQSMLGASGREQWAAIFAASATQAQVDAGTNATAFVSPLTLANRTATANEARRLINAIQADVGAGGALADLLSSAQQFGMFSAAFGSVGLNCPSGAFTLQTNYAAAYNSIEGSAWDGSSLTLTNGGLVLISVGLQQMMAADVAMRSVGIAVNLNNVGTWHDVRSVPAGALLGGTPQIVCVVALPSGSKIDVSLYQDYGLAKVMKNHLTILHLGTIR